jgi:hypothetical protein
VAITASDEHLITAGGTAVVIAGLAFAVYWIPTAVGILGGNPQSPLDGLLWLGLLAAIAVPGALGVWAAWRRKPVVAWVVAALFVIVWVWRQPGAVVAVIPVLSVVAATLVTRAARHERRPFRLA